MTLKSRLAGLVAVLLICAVAPSAFAQVQITIIPDIDNGDIATNNNALPASPGVNGSGVLVVGSLIASSPLTATVLRINYPGPITALASGSASFAGGANCTIGGTSALSTSAGTGASFVCNNGVGVPSNDAIRISGASGVFASVGTATPLLNTTNQRIEILLPGTTSTNVNSSSGSFRLVGVRINANGLTGAQTVSASLNTSVNNYLIGSPSTGTVINSLNPGIAALAIGLAPGNGSIGGVSTNPGAGTATIFTNGNVARSIGSFILTEGCASCWRSATQNSNNGGNPAAVDNSTQIRLTFANVPVGVTLNLSLNTGTASSNSSLAATILSGTSITSASSTAIINFTGSSTTQIETLEVDFTTTTTTTAAITTPGSITVTATTFPIGTGTGSDPTLTSVTNVPTESAGYPTFTDLEVGPITLVNIVPANTTLLMPYAITLPPYDTGLALANTTSDPFGSGTGGATKSAGTVTLTFFNTPATGTPTSFSLTTSSTVRPGGGLASDGTLPSGAVWTVLLSQLLTAAGQTGNFTGYIFIQANFLDAHGTATISDFRTYSLTSNVLVLPPPATTPRTAPSGGAEALNN